MAEVNWRPRSEVSWAGLEGFLESPVGPLDHPVALWVVRRGGVVVRADDLAGAGPQGRGELGPLVRCEAGREEEAERD